MSLFSSYRWIHYFSRNGSTGLQAMFTVNGEIAVVDSPTRVMSGALKGIVQGTKRIPVHMSRTPFRAAI
jgi:hypothetical protein